MLAPRKSKCSASISAMSLRTIEQNTNENKRRCWLWKSCRMPETAQCVNVHLIVCHQGITGALHTITYRSLGMPPLCSQLLPSAVPWPVMWKVLFFAPLKIVSGQCEYHTVKYLGLIMNGNLVEHVCLWTSKLCWLNSCLSPFLCCDVVINDCELSDRLHRAQHYCVVPYLIFVEMTKFQICSNNYLCIINYYERLNYLRKFHMILLLLSSLNLRNTCPTVSCLCVIYLLLVPFASYSSL